MNDSEIIHLLNEAAKAGNRLAGDMLRIYNTESTTLFGAAQRILTAINDCNRNDSLAHTLYFQALCSYTGQGVQKDTGKALEILGRMDERPAPGVPLVEEQSKDIPIHFLARQLISRIEREATLDWIDPQIERCCRAIANGDLPALRCLAEIYFREERRAGAQPAPPQIVKRFALASANGDLAARLALAACYFHGLAGVEQSYERAWILASNVGKEAAAAAGAAALSGVSPGYLEIFLSNTGQRFLETMKAALKAEVSHDAARAQISSLSPAL